MARKIEIDPIEYTWKDRKRTIFGLPWSFTKYAISSDRLFVTTGFFNIKEDEVRLYRIMDLELKRNFRQRIWGLGTIEVHSSDKSLGHFAIKHIKNPRQVKELLSQAIESERDKKRVVNRELMSDHDCDFDSDEFFPNEN